MQSSTRRPLRRARRALLLITVATVVATLAAPSAAAVSVRRAWKAQLGGNGANGTATLTAYWTGNGAMTLKLVGLQPSTTYPIIAYRGSCAKPTLITRLPGAVTDANGTVTKTSAVSTRIMNSIWAYGRTNPFSIKIGTGALARCGVLNFAVATRIAIPSLKIDLPVIRPGSGYPLCNVAMYIRELSQPREAGVTLLYAHARKGMFLPLLERSRINNGASLVGATVKVWTSNNLVSTYRITRVRRHVSSLDGVFDIGQEQLWIQTSEGPRGTVGKLIVVAKRVSYEASSHEAAHPTPHPVVCR
jgi:sortase (surface protein transpeptidase)